MYRKEAIIGHKNNESGYVFAPYITYDLVANPSFGNANMIKCISEIRSEKIEKILLHLENGF